MTLIDFTLLGQHHHLRLEQESDHLWTVVNLNGNPDLPLRRGTLLECVRFIDVFAMREDATVDEASVEVALKAAADQAVAWARGQRTADVALAPVIQLRPGKIVA
jgi:hypothetical protein